MHSSSIKHSIEISGRQTSISLEDPFWFRLKRMARERNVPVCKLVTMIDQEPRQQQRNLSSVVRQWILQQVSGDLDDRRP
jgi:predicted DNA-binding ribbon-helix-helix protein